MTTMNYAPVFNPEPGVVFDCNGNPTREKPLAPRPPYAQLRALCRRDGHRIVDDSHGGPESGCVSLYCARCGWSHHVTMY